MIKLVNLFLMLNASISYCIAQPTPCDEYEYKGDFGDGSIPDYLVKSPRQVRLHNCVAAMNNKHPKAWQYLTSKIPEPNTNGVYEEDLSDVFYHSPEKVSEGACYEFAHRGTSEEQAYVAARERRFNEKERVSFCVTEIQSRYPVATARLRKLLLEHLSADAKDTSNPKKVRALIFSLKSTHPN